MFRLSDPAADAAGSRSRRLMRRAFLFGAALLLLWLAVQMMPAPQPPSASVYSDGSGTVAARSGSPPVPARERGMFQPGTLIAFLLLAGGGGFALYLRHHKQEPTTAAVPIELMGQMQIAQNQQLRLISCGGEVLLLGVTAGQITLLKSYPSSAFTSSEPVHVKEAPGLQAPTSTLPPRFSDLLRQQVGLSSTP